MDKKPSKLFHRIKTPNAIAPLHTINYQYSASANKRRRIMLYMSRLLKKQKIHSTGLIDIVGKPTGIDDIKKFCEKCPTTGMSRFLEKKILEKVDAKGLEYCHPDFLKKVMEEVREEFLKITREAGVRMIVKSDKRKFQVGQYKLLGRTENYHLYLQIRKKLQRKFILHQPLIRKILNECIVKLPYVLLNLHSSLKHQYDISSFQKHITDCANETVQNLQHFYRNIITLVEHNDTNNSKSYLSACTGLLSVNISRSIAHTFLHLADFTGAKDHVSYLQLNITFKERLILSPISEDIVETFSSFLEKVIKSVKQFYVLEKYKLRGYENKQIFLCITEDFVEKIKNQIRKNIEEKFVPILQFIKNLDMEFADIYSDISSVGDEIASDIVFDQGCEKIQYFKSYLPKVAFIPDNAYFVIGQLNIIEYREVLQQTLLNIINGIFQNLSNQHRWENSDICEGFSIINIRAQQKPCTTEELIEIGRYMSWVKSDYVEELKQRIAEALAKLAVLIQLGRLDEIHLYINAKAINWLDKIVPILEENTTTFEQLKFEAEEKLQRVIEEINVDIKDVYPLLDILDSMDNIENVRSYLNSITLHMVKIKKVEDKIMWINSEEVSLSFPKSTYTEFDDLKNYVYPFYRLLKLCLDVQRHISVWMDGQFSLIQYDKVKKVSEEYHQELLSTQKVYRNKLRQAQDENLLLRFKGTVDDPDMLNWPAPLKLCAKAIKLIQDFEPSLTVIRIMCNEALMKRHWEKMSQVANLDITPNAGTTLRKLIQIDLSPNLTQYEIISLAATKEKELFQSLTNMEEEWSSITLAITENRVTGLETIETITDDHLMKVTNMLNSIYVKPYLEKVKEFYADLIKIKETKNEFAETQEELLELKDLFKCKHITCHMPYALNLHGQILQIYTNYLELISTKPNVYTLVKTTNLLPDLRLCNQQLEYVRKEITLYFTQIRKDFPRLYFLSDEEMFKILGKAPQDFQNIIQNLFGGVRNLIIHDDTIKGVEASQGEVLLLEENINIGIYKGCIEKWLKELEEKLTTRMRKKIQEADFNSEISQVNVVVLEVFFTADVHAGLQNCNLEKVEQKIHQNIDGIMTDLRSNLSNSTMKRRLSNMLVVLAHHKDILRHLLELKVSTEQDFEWLAQLRYYLKESCVVQLLDNTFSYRYQYHGDSPQIVVTPTTYRCYHSLLFSYKHHLNVCLLGVGKTETIKGLASALGVFCYFFNCFKNFRFDNFLKGATLSNAWLCLENFDTNRLELISMFAHEVMQINLQCFIACNIKSYIELPQNFKVLFRPINLIAPDLLTICQVKCFASGFKKWEILARELVRIHYLVKTLIPEATDDIRTIKEILDKSATAYARDNEEEMFNYCISDVFRKRLSSKDLKIFDSIIQKKFEQPQRLDLIEKLALITKTSNLCFTNTMIKKIIQVHDCIQHYAGIVILGQSYTGKSTIIKILQQIVEQDVVIKTIYLKTFTQNQFFGCYKKKKWCDGIFTNFLHTVTDIWIVIDGGILDDDKLNTMLDDTKTLCLSSGQVLRINPLTKIIFEVDTLDQASPGLISRCGVVYLPNNCIGWKSIAVSWIKKNYEWHKNNEELFEALFDWVVPPCLIYLKNHCNLLHPQIDLSLVKTTLQVLEMLLNDAYESIRKNEEDPKNLSSWIQASFIQGVIWGLGAALDSKSRLKFDEFFKQLWKGQIKEYPYPKVLDKVEVNVPLDGLIFDHSYFYKSKGTWKYWPDVLKNEKIEESDYFTEFFVPIIETVKYTALLKLHLSNGYPIILLGPPGSGKKSCIRDTLANKIDKNSIETAFVTFPRNTPAKLAQRIILSKLTKKKTGLYKAQNCKTSLLFIDDLNISTKTEVLELLREIIEQKTFYKKDSFETIQIENLNVFLTEKSSTLCPRFARHFNVFSFNRLCEESICRIFSNILFVKWKRAGFSSDIINTANQIVSATFHFYSSVHQLQPSVTWNFQSFSILDLLRVVKVCSMIKKESADSNKKLFFKLWVHEILRILGDRIHNHNKTWLHTNLKYCINEFFKEDITTLFDNLPTLMNKEPDFSKLFFGCYNGKLERFDETDIEKLKETATNCLKEYNREARQKIDLLFFDHILEHLSKMCRVLALPQSNLIQLGFCGTGRKSLMRLACAMYNQKFFYLELPQEFSQVWWQTVLKSVLKEAGGFGKPCAFFIKEDQIISDVIANDIECLVRSGQVPFLYSIEENQELLNLVRETIQDPFLDKTSENIFLQHQKRCINNLHLILSFNANNPRKVQYFFKQYPSMKELCQIIIFEKWPQEALYNLANYRIQEINMNKDFKSQIVSVFSEIHTELEDLYSIDKVTTGSYLHFLTIYHELTLQKQTSIIEVKNKYLNALQKLSFAALQISEMQKSLAEYQPQLEEMTAKAIEMAKQIETETNEVEKASNLVKKDEEIANEQAAAAQVLKLDCEADLAQAIPILEDAISALNTLKPTDITLVKSMKNPPDAIKLVMAAVCVIKDVKPDRIPDPSTGRKTLDYWGPSKRILGDMNFLQTLKDFDKDNIKPDIMVKIRKDYLPHKDFKPHIVAKASSAAEGLCKWIIAMDMYDKVAKEVAPKKEKLEKAERKYGATVAILNEKKEQVARIEQKLADLNTLLKDATLKQQKLQRNVDECKRKLSRAQNLINGLSEEKIRWTTAVENLEKQYVFLPGDILLSSAIITYLGRFSKKKRQILLENWLEKLHKNNIPHNPKYLFHTDFEKDIDLDEWLFQGLPQDNYFKDNGIISVWSKKWCLAIDPQNIAQNWIKTVERPNKLRTTKFTEDFYSNLVDCLEMGKPLLVRNVSEKIPSFLDNIIARNIWLKNQNEYFNIGNEEIINNIGFKLYLITNLKNPNFATQIYDKLTIVNFGINQDALEDNLLTQIIEIEKPTLKKIRNDLQTQSKTNKDALILIEEKILKTLSESKADILEDEKALQILDESKVMSKTVTGKCQNLEELKTQLNVFKKSYKSISKHSAILYYTIFHLSRINHMYQFSYVWFIETYCESIQSAQKFKNLENRCRSIQNTFTWNLCQKISRSIFGKDRLLFLLLLCINLDLGENHITKEEVKFFAASASSEKQSNQPPWLSPKTWNQICSLSKLSNFTSFSSFFMKNQLEYQKITEDSHPEDQTFPAPYNSNFQKLLLIKILRRDKLVQAVRKYIRFKIGIEYLEETRFDLAASFKESYILTPLLFVLTALSDPIKSLTAYARLKHFENKLLFLSNNDSFDELLRRGREQGLWLCFQNCHLDPIRLLDLERKFEKIDYENTHENFRLWLTAEECTEFPLSLLERSIKIIKQAPCDVKNKLLYLYNEEPLGDSKFFTGCPTNHELFVQYLYRLVVMYCSMIERQKFGKYAWKSSYCFNEWDFQNSLKEVKLILERSTNIYQEIVHLIEICIYGNQLIEKVDKTFFQVFLQDYLINHFGYVTFPSKSDYQDYITHVLNLPEYDTPETVGLPTNYQIVKDLSESNYLSEFIQISLNACDIRRTIEDPSELIDDLLKQLPEDLEIVDEQQQDFILVQEKTLHNQLSHQIKNNLQNLQQSIRSSAVLTKLLEGICCSITKNQVPRAWMANMLCPNQYNLTKFIINFKMRVEYFRHLKIESPICLSYFFNPQAFLITKKLIFGREHNVPIEQICYQLKSVANKSKNYILISEINLIGAAWNDDENIIEELPLKIIYHKIPTAKLIFSNSEKLFFCPLYQNLNWKSPKNFISDILVNSKLPISHWIKRGSALLCDADYNF